MFNHSGFTYLLSHCSTSHCVLTCLFVFIFLKKNCLPFVLVLVRMELTFFLVAAVFWVWYENLVEEC